MTTAWTTGTTTDNPTSKGQKTGKVNTTKVRKQFSKTGSGETEVQRPSSTPNSKKARMGHSSQDLVQELIPRRKELQKLRRRTTNAGNIDSTYS
ncbi:hypothetical protein ILYODFUR_021857 [Ilyodon furcidens]|uniref:Uncharacterized protein n=1 Tax=Ilyodon furcidens TaxID=33524 RepID=A0ABV0SZ10_9TELE